MGPKINVRKGQYVRIFKDKEIDSVLLVPTTKLCANARILEVENDGFEIKVHWLPNYNLEGDFSTELMTFFYSTRRDLFELDEGDKDSRNELRRANGLVETDF